MAQPQVEKAIDRTIFDSSAGGNIGWIIGGAVLIVAMTAGWVLLTSVQPRASASTTIDIGTPPAVELESPASVEARRSADTTAN